MANEVDKQQRATNLLLAGNLYKSHKIQKGIENLTKVTQEGQAQTQKVLNVVGDRIDQQNRMMKIKELNERAAKDRIKAVNQIFFIVSEELDVIDKTLKSKKKNNLEIYFKLLSLNAEFENNDISPSAVDTYAEKKELSNAIKKIDSHLTSVKKKLSKSELKDLDKIMDILEVNEEEEIEKLNSSVLAKAENARKNKIKWFENSLQNKCGEVLYLFPIERDDSRTKLIYKIGHLKIKNSKYKVNMGRDLEYAWKDIWNVDKNAASYWYNSFVRELIKNFGVLELLQVRSMINDWRSKYSRGASWANTGVVGSIKSLLGKKKTDEDVWNDFKKIKKNKKIFDKIQKINIQKIIENSYSNLKKDREKELVKINKLKNTIKKEQKEVKDIYKRHPFVRTIIKSRS